MRNHQDTFGKVMPYTEAGAGNGTHHPAAFVVSENSQIDRPNNAYFFVYRVYRSVESYDNGEPSIAELPVFAQGAAFDGLKTKYEQDLAADEWLLAQSLHPDIFGAAEDYQE